MTNTRQKKWVRGFLVAISLLFLMGYSGGARAQTPKSTVTNIKNYTFNTTKALQGGNTSANIQEFLGRAIGILLMLVASVGIVVGIYGGIRMITSQGNDAGLKKGQGAFSQALVGVVIVLLAYIIISFIKDLLLNAY